MTKLQLVYPVIRFHTIEVELPDDDAENLMVAHDDDKARFINEQNEKLDLPELCEIKMIAAALDTEYATIKRIL